MSTYLAKHLALVLVSFSFLAVIDYYILSYGRDATRLSCVCGFNFAVPFLIFGSYNGDANDGVVANLQNE